MHDIFYSSKEKLKNFKKFTWFWGTLSHNYRRLFGSLTDLFNHVTRVTFVTLFDLPQNTNNDKTRQLHKSK